MNARAPDTTNHHHQTDTIGTGLLDLLAPRVRAGQAVFADAMRRAVFRLVPDLFDQLDLGDDAVFLNPVAIAAVAHHQDAGPQVARLRTVLTCGAGTLDDSGHDVGMRLLADPAADFERAVFGHEKCLPGTKAAAREHRLTLKHTVRTLELIWPELSQLLHETVRYLVLFDDDELNSFASRSTHGVAYLNVALGRTVPFFLEDIAHQGGHVLFNAAWVGGESFIRVDRDAEMAAVAGQADDQRSIEVAIHGIVTQGLMVSTLDRYLVQASDGAELGEPRARLLFALCRLGRDIRALSGSAVFTDDGVHLFNEVAEIRSALLNRYYDALAIPDFTGQSYNFDYAIFQRHNANAYRMAVTSGSGSHA